LFKEIGNIVLKIGKKPVPRGWKRFDQDVSYGKGAAVI
jgi:hypothetical protein